MPDEPDAKPIDAAPEPVEAALPADHPLQGVFGVWKDQPDRVERMVDAVARYRQKIAREEAAAARAAK